MYILIIDQNYNKFKYKLLLSDIMLLKCKDIPKKK